LRHSRSGLAHIARPGHRRHVTDGEESARLRYACTMIGSPMLSLKVCTQPWPIA
jgi:hypothetical protein